MDTQKPKPGCDDVEVSGDVFRDGMEKVGKEIQEGQFQYLANSRKGFEEAVKQAFNLKEEEKMSQLSKFLGGLWKDLEAPFVGAINSVKQAFESKDAQGVINSVASLVKVGAVAIENASTEAAAVGTKIVGPDKKAAVQSAVSNIVAPQIKNLEIPGVDSATIQNFFGGLLDSLIGHLIDAGVAELNKNGWKL